MKNELEIANTGSEKNNSQQSRQFQMNIMPFSLVSLEYKSNIMLFSLISLKHTSSFEIILIPSSVFWGVV